jgi:hypothetical protein
VSVLEFTVPPGPLVSQPVPAPAAGADFTITTPDTLAQGVWQIVSIRARLVTSATVANRFVALTVKDEVANEVCRVGFDTAITAGLTVFCTFTPAVSTVVGGVTNVKALTFPLPAGPYPSRTAFSSVTTNVDTGDQWSQIAVIYQRLTPNYFQE